MEGLFALGYEYGSKKLNDGGGHSTVVVFSPKRWRRRSKQSRSSGDEPSPPEAPTDTELTYENAPMQKHLLKGVKPRSGPTRCDDLGLKSRGRGLLGGATPEGPPRPPTIESAASKQATPTQETIGRSPRVLKRACCPPPLDFKPISSYTVFVSQARTCDASEMKSKKKVTATGLGLGLPSTTGGRKPTRVRDDNDAHSLDLVGRLHPNYRPSLPKRSSSSLPAPEARPGLRPLQFPPTPQLWPIDPVEPPDHISSPVELTSPPICDAKNRLEAKSAPACQLYFDGISRRSSGRTHRPLTAKAPAFLSHPSWHTQLVVPPAYRRASSFLKEAIASLPGSALCSPIPPSLLGTPYLESVSSPFSTHFQPHRGNRRVASEGLRRSAWVNVNVDVDDVDEHWIDVNVASLRMPPQLGGLSSLTTRLSPIPGGKAGKGPSGRRRERRRSGVKGGAYNPYFADVGHTHSSVRGVLQSV